MESHDLKLRIPDFKDGTSVLETCQYTRHQAVSNLQLSHPTIRRITPLPPSK